MSLVETLRKQELIARRNDLQKEILDSSRAERRDLVEKDTTSAQAQLASVNAELKALDRHKEKSKLNFLA